MLSSDGRAVLAEIARRHGVSTDAAEAMFDAVNRGGGSMAQFSHPEFGGMGQWMRGGMTMVSNLFDNHLKSRVENICYELSNLVSNPPPGFWAPTPAPAAGNSFGYGNQQNWWPEELGWPNSSGRQNDMAYAYFAGPRRLAVDLGGTVTIFDTGDHAISGVSQQQGGIGTISFSSQFGTVPIGMLRIVGTTGPRQ